MPATCINSLRLRKRPHRFGRIAIRIETDGDDPEAVLSQNLTRGSCRFVEMLRRCRANVMAGREYHTDDQRFAAEVMESNGIAVGIDKRMIADLVADSGLRYIQCRVWIVQIDCSSRDTAEAAHQQYITNYLVSAECHHSSQE